jgi:hypothetical protein
LPSTDLGPGFPQDYDPGIHGDWSGQSDERREAYFGATPEEQEYFQSPEVQAFFALIAQNMEAAGVDMNVDHVANGALANSLGR